MSEPREEPEPEAEAAGELPEPLETLLLQAAGEGATDIHLDPADDGLLIRFRVDGMVHVKELVSAETGQRLLHQIRIAADLGTERTFVPVGSQIVWWDGTEKRDIRVVVAPTGLVEAAHLRLLFAADKVADINGLGFRSEDLEKVLSTVKISNGLILLAGPTGAGKTTTLYSLVSALDMRSIVAVSIEDPVEFDLPHLRQLQVNERHGLTMYEGLRSLLRMDPDVILVGEIRDQQSAVAAARAALAGRLVLATIHAADAATAVDALHYLSVPYHVLGGSLRLVIAQNLVRRVCKQCAKRRPLTPRERALFERAGVAPPEEVRRAFGCKYCNSYGYTGRVGVFETALLDKAAAEAIMAGAHHQELRELFRANGIPSLLTDALTKVAEGITTMEEVLQFHWPASADAL